MDIKDYINSGILESYVLGTTTLRETKEVECMSKIYEEIKEELEAIQSSAEAIALSKAVTPPAHLKQKVMQAIVMVDQDKPENKKENADRSPTFVAPIKDKNTTVNYSKFMVAASIALIAAFAFLYWNSTKSNNQLKGQLASLSEKNQVLTEKVGTLEQNNINTAYLTTMLASVNTEKVVMKGTDYSPNSNASVFWNKETKSVYLLPELLDETNAEEQYQLWAIVDGKPVDMGVFDAPIASSSIQKMPFEVENAQAFAVTIEKKGGSPTPTMEKMVVVGTV